MNWRDRITVDPQICHGHATVKGTRIMVSIILDNLAAGETPESLLRSYPTLQPEDLRATLLYASELAQERFVAAPPIPA